MCKKIFVLTFVLIISTYLIVLAGPTLPWGSWDTQTASKTAPNGVFLNAYVAFNLVRLANPNWNYRSYHWAGASNTGANTIGIEFKHDNNITYGPYQSQDNDGWLDKNGSQGVWEHDKEQYSTKVAGNTIQPYTAIWSPYTQRWADRTATAQRPTPYTVPAW